MSKPITVILREPRQRLNAIDGFRALSALYVVGHHAMLQFWPVSGPRPTDRLILAITGTLLYGRFAVAIFIVISGFCLMIPLVKTNGRMEAGVRDFIKRRLMRLVPPYYASIVISLFIALAVRRWMDGNSPDLRMNLTASGVVTHLLLMQDVLAPYVGGQINGVYWSIAVEWHIYCLFPCILYAWRRGPIVFGLTLVSAGTAGFVLARIGYGYLHLHFIFLFGLGMVAAHVALSPATRAAHFRAAAPWGLLTCLTTILAITYCRFLPPTAPASIMTIQDSAWGAAVAIGLIAVVRNSRSAGARLVGSAPLAKIGQFSYSLYLIHAPLLFVFWTLVIRVPRLGADCGFLLSLACGLPVILGISYLFYLLFERPWLMERLCPKNGIRKDILSRSVALDEGGSRRS